MVAGDAPAVSVRGLSRRYGRKVALRDVSFEVGEGELFGIVGSDGAGKTTLIQSLCAILDPSEGSVTIHGMDSVRQASSITRTIGYVSQAWSLYGDLSVAENLQFFAAVRGLAPSRITERKQALLKFSRLSPFLDRRTRDLSGGMQKKLALSCSLMHEPDLVILDEPTLGVDPLSRRELWRMLDEYRVAGKTILIATSYMDEAARCDRVLALADGQVRGCDVPSAFGPDLELAFSSAPIPARTYETRMPPSPRPVGEIRTEKLTRRFGDFVAVDEVDLDIRPGEVFGLLGPNGCGKSTLIRMLCGILAPSSGSAEVAGRSIVSDVRAARSAIGYMSQRFSLYLDLSVQENIDFFGSVYGLQKTALRAARDRVVRSADLAGRESTRVKSLSGAVRQRLALGCAMLHQPAVLFLDEPTSGVDPVTRGNFWRMMQGIASAGTTVFVTTHYLLEAEACDRVAFMNAGSILDVGTPQALCSRYGAPTLEEAFVRAMGAA